jgi:hypothetical protein
MTDAKFDNNKIPVLLLLDLNDGSTPIRMKADPTNHQTIVSDGAGGSDHGGTRALRDNNDVPVAIAVSNSDGVTPVAIYGNSATGAILTNPN